MNIKCLIFSTLILSIYSLNAQFRSSSFHQDSLFLESEPSNQVYFNYKVNKKQTLYNISKSFHVALDSLKAINKDLQISGLQENGLLKIPFNKTQIVPDGIKMNDSRIGLYYKIKPGESLYNLSKRKFDINLQKLMKLNKLENTNIRNGSILLIGYYHVDDFEPIPVNIENKAIHSVEEPQIESEIFTNQSRGVAISEYEELGSGRLFALHNTAKMDSQIEIENPVLNRKVLAKVIGRIPPIYERDVQIIVSAEAARLLGAVDKRFFVSLRYR